MPSTINLNESPPLDAHQVYSVLQPFGGSLLGAQQLSSQQIVTSPKDRVALAKLILSVDRDQEEGQSTGKRQWAPLKQVGGSVVGGQQLLTGQIVTDPKDRAALAKFVTEILRVDFIYHQITWTNKSGKGMSMDDWH